MRFERDSISLGQYDEVHLPQRVPVQSSVISYDNDWRIFCTSDIGDCATKIHDDLPTIGATDEQEVLPDRHRYYLHYFRGICISSFEVWRIV